MSGSAENRALIASLIRDVVDFPQPGIVFKDITPLLGSPTGYAAAIAELAAAAPDGVDYVVGMEARGFVFAGPVALALGAGFVPVRKPGKLPSAVYTQTYALEYGEETLAIHADALPAGARVMIVDDVLATGGTIAATVDLVRRLGAEVVQVSVLLELGFLNGRGLLASHDLADPSAVLSL
ncbi:MAG: adenine phosphoribosyltransferase [Actinobacteria bacterium HGW-Actinobacteria-2]|nr:MAG: adenine phosphoribosyltransferase [Actinobacteria bacterium HGW-Actinobacteria-2]